MKNYKSNFITITNTKGINKPNEDYCLCDDTNGIYILMDGVSRDKVNGVYPTPSPSFQVSKIFAETVYEFIEQNIDENINILDILRDAIKKGNYEISDFNKKVRWENDFLPGTVGVVSLLREDMLYYAYIGDCYGFIINTEKTQFTECQTREIVKHKKEFTSYEIRNCICNNKTHPYSYGVLNGDARAMDFVVGGKKRICKRDKILLCSDGFSDIVTKLLGKELYQMSLSEIAEHSKEQDDKTMIIIEERTYDKEDC